MKKRIINFKHAIPKDIEEILAASPKLKAKWDNLTQLAQNEWICYVTIVKNSKTRQRHLKRLEEDLLNGKKRPCCWPGCPHRNQNTQKWFLKTYKDN
ncbi:MAG: hypothetical protein KatS3mg089_0604 [Patescibacteria group bacterium]|nr:MAG: hypothetical protein KatS3mg089_0604 [Patescibacteria group bacterium]